MYIRNQFPGTRARRGWRGLFFKLKNTGKLTETRQSKLDANPGTELKSEAAFAAAIRALKKKKKVSHVHNNTTATNTHTHPGSKGDSSRLPGPRGWARGAPDTLLTPVRDARARPFPQQICARRLGGRGGGSQPAPRAPGRAAAGGALLPVPAPAQVPGAAASTTLAAARGPPPPSRLSRPSAGSPRRPPPAQGEPSAAEDPPSGPAPGELTTCSSRWGLAHREGAAHSSR